MDKVNHFEIPAKNIEILKPFYENVFGWKIEKVPDMNYYMIYTTINIDKETQKGNEANVINGGMFEKGDAPIPPVIFSTVDSIDDRITKIKEQGGSVIKEKMAVGNIGFIAYIKDPEGNTMGMWEDA